jgi:hypothetical protein
VRFAVVKVKIPLNRLAGAQLHPAAVVTGLVAGKI